MSLFKYFFSYFFLIFLVFFCFLVYFFFLGFFFDFFVVLSYFEFYEPFFGDLETEGGWHWTYFYYSNTFLFSFTIPRAACFSALLSNEEVFLSWLDRSWRVQSGTIWTFWLAEVLLFLLEGTFFTILYFRIWLNNVENLKI